MEFSCTRFCSGNSNLAYKPRGLLEGLLRSEIEYLALLYSFSRKPFAVSRANPADLKDQRYYEGITSMIWCNHTYNIDPFAPQR